MDYTFSDLIGIIKYIILDHKLSIILIIIAITIEVVARSVRDKIKKRIFSQYDTSVDRGNSEYYLEYYRKIQFVDLIRVISIVVILVMFFVLNTGLDINFFAVATGAIIITFKDFILSIIAFFFVTPQYPIGLTVKVGGVQGQIIFIRMLSVGLIGKDENGENTGELFTIPSHKFFTETVEKEDLRSGSIVRDEIEIPYNKKNFTLNFRDFMAVLRPFLQTTFPVKNTKNAGNYQSYIGHKYKLDYRYQDEKCTLIRIRFIGKPEQNINYKEQIISFVDQYTKAE